MAAARLRLSTGVELRLAAGEERVFGRKDTGRAGALDACSRCARA